MNHENHVLKFSEVSSVILKNGIIAKVCLKGILSVSVLHGNNPMERRYKKMRKYEVIFIAHPDLDEENLNSVVEKVKGWIADDKGEVVSVDNWGKKKLAYRIRKQREGQYVLITANMEPASVKNLSQNMRFVESIMRSMITVVDED